MPAGVSVGTSGVNLESWIMDQWAVHEYMMWEERQQQRINTTSISGHHVSAGALSTSPQQSNVLSLNETNVAAAIQLTHREVNQLLNNNDRLDHSQTHCGDDDGDGGCVGRCMLHYV